MFKWFSNLFDSNDKELSRLWPFVEKINQLEPQYKKLKDDDLRSKTDEFKERLKNGATLDEIMVEAYAVVREASRRTIGLRQYDVQLLGGIALHQGKIAEMKTGEGKTLAATLPLYLNALTGKGAHLVTVNDYLARRDPYWMAPIYNFLGISVASIYPQQTNDERAPARIYDPDYNSEEKDWPHFKPIPRKEAYQADVTYGTSSEFGFDYLRDNMALDLKQCVQRELNYAIVDEVDNLLIDEARTPLIISGMREQSLKEYQILAKVVRHLNNEDDYIMNEKGRGVDEITEEGFENAEKWLQREGLLDGNRLYDAENARLLHNLRNAITAKEAYRKDREYVIQNGQVVIVDEFTGRLMLGRRYSAGLHQAIEAKEGVTVQKESMTFATITVQNYFRMYQKLAGMTGTAVTEAEEFHKIYELEVVVIPTNKNTIREDLPDLVYRNEDGKFKAVVDKVVELNREKRPVLLGTTSVEKSQRLSDALRRKGIKHNILNAKNHEKEAATIAGAGLPGAVTVATNMAGRGVDIVLGGSKDDIDDVTWQKKHQQVLDMGGLYVIGTERHEARRIDNQLRGRSGRQGDPGTSLFYVSLEDDVMRRFGGDRISGLMQRVGMEEDVAIENRLVTRAIENSQDRVEGYHFDIRKHLVEYDDVVNTQREIIYQERHKMLSGLNLKDNILEMVKQELSEIISEYTNTDGRFEADYKGLLSAAATILPLPEDFSMDTITEMSNRDIEEKLLVHAVKQYDVREQEIGAEHMRLIERLIMLRIIDSLWIDHLTAMEEMRQGIGMEAIAQHDPLVAYKRRGHEMFQSLMARIRGDVSRAVYHFTVKRGEANKPAPSPMAQVRQQTNTAAVKNKPVAKGKKVGRNAPCPCGSGKKYKNCCGRNK